MTTTQGPIEYAVNALEFCNGDVARAVAAVNNQNMDPAFKLDVTHELNKSLPSAAEGEPHPAHFY